MTLIANRLGLNILNFRQKSRRVNFLAITPDGIFPTAVSLRAWEVYLPSWTYILLFHGDAVVFGWQSGSQS